MKTGYIQSIGNIYTLHFQTQVLTSRKKCPLFFWWRNYQSKVVYDLEYEIGHITSDIKIDVPRSIGSSYNAPKFVASSNWWTWDRYMSSIRPLIRSSYCKKKITKARLKFILWGSQPWLIMDEGAVMCPWLISECRLIGLCSNFK